MPRCRMAPKSTSCPLSRADRLGLDPMDRYGLTWKPSSNEPRADFCFAIHKAVRDALRNQVPDLANLTPVMAQFAARLTIRPGWIGCVIDYSTDPSVPTIGDLEPDEISKFEALSSCTTYPSPEDVEAALGFPLVSHQSFAYVGPHVDGRFSWQHVSEHWTRWLNHHVLPWTAELNRVRILRAIPAPPSFAVPSLLKSLWVLESETAMKQGTGFSLKGVGLVTCAHVLAPDTVAFRPETPSEQFQVEVKAFNNDIDLAILTDPAPRAELELGESDGMQVLDHLAIAGFPNYRIGDTGNFVPGSVTGFRTMSGINRILTNAPIVAGASGAPVLDADSRVIGIAATGADRMEIAHETEHHSIIPAAALELLIH